MFFVGFVESDVVFAHEVVALHSRRGRGLAVTEQLPGQHRLADVDAAVVDEVRLDHFVARFGEYLRDRVSEQVVADVAQVQRLVGVGRRIFDHHRFAGGGAFAEIGVGHHLGEPFAPERVAQREVQEALDDVIAFDFGNVFHQRFADLRGGFFGFFAAEFQQREDHERVVALEFLAGFLDLDGGRIGRPV